MASKDLKASITSILSEDPVFDWGNVSQGSLPSARRDFERSNSYPSNSHVSRHAPRTMNRSTADAVFDDLYDNDSDDGAISDVELKSGKQQKQTKYGPGGVRSSHLCRQTITILSLVGIIVAASLAIGYAVINVDPSNFPYFAASDNGIPEQQELLEIAERVITACSENELNGDRSECQQLCHLKLCCFESGEYSCEEDESKDCAVYAGCKALVEGIPLEAAEEDQKQTKYGPGGVRSSHLCRQTITILSLVGIIVAASLAIGYAVINVDPSNFPYFAASDNGIPEQQELLEIAERVITACSENELNGDRSECQQLCHLKLCCFESGEYSCEEDESKDCAVYAGCKALVEGIPLEAAEEDEESL
eukprot:CAMPEP_0201944994 /NCGR_PEP_ID=MMETSP0903-20130614/53678_1 /ASSEMBLY_ACC=CAM_ASM_000552 /TAXON_ID=420261 /ORGANISM="Thalassiosira antarctica, Strain CCMP982" /LENGTH=363 /DNA_ID=CAMNT_0048488053 /DNA_START=35 /DNA_END=1124 /DNA_ORIENTATION=-